MTVRRADTVISPQAISLYRRLVEFEKLGGVEDEVSDLENGLNRVLDRRQPWLTSILDTRDLAEPPSWVKDKADWRAAREIRLTLDAAIAES